MAHNGEWNGQQIVPKQWLLYATTVAAGDPDIAAALSWHYGYQLFILPGERRMFLLAGIYGQAIFVDPESKLVMVQTAVRMKAIGDPQSAEALAL